MNCRNPASRERAQKESDAIRDELDRLRSTNHTLYTQLFDANQRGHELANALGFKDIYQAHSVVCASGSKRDFTYQSAIELAEGRENDLSDERDANQKLREVLKVAEEERDSLRRQLRLAKQNQDGAMSKEENPTIVNTATAPPSKSAQLLTLELSTLQSRYESLLEVHLRGLERYKTDYAKWRAFKEWLFDEETQNNKNRRKDRKDAETPGEKQERRRKNAKVMKKRRMLLQMGPGLCGLETGFMGRDAESNKENVAITARDTVPKSSTSPPPKKKRRLELGVQPLSPSISSRSPSTAVIPKPNTLARNTAPCPPIVPTPLSALPSKPDNSELIPLKSRSVQAEVKETTAGSSDTEDDSQDSNLLKGEKAHADGKLGEKENKNSPEPTQSTALRTPVATEPTTKVLNDYSAYKGHGRYAQQVPKNKNTINALYTIDPARNGGCDFAYEEVVRGKEDRRKMDAGDCESCRDYYEAIGTLPDRLQPPLWRSRSPSPVGRCQHRGLAAIDPKDVDTASDEGRHRAIASHKQAISRHRHRWERASTPPGYWNIGFPNTQEVSEINEKAKEMHRVKMTKVKGEVVRGDGKYKKR